jgi:hypothetical protein
MKEQPLKSEGKCVFCGKTFAKAGISRHLQAHLAKKATENQNGASFLVKVEPHSGYGPTPYFLSLWVDGNTTMKKVDKFLRDIWLECCGHLSEFTDPKAQKSGGDMHSLIEALNMFVECNQKFKDFSSVQQGAIPMEQKAKQVFHKGMKLEHEYDFGSSTVLVLTAIEEYPVKADENIVLLSRNEPPEMPCQLCGKESATQLCAVHGEGEANFFCEKCAEKHAEECPDFEYAAMPVVNSPRMGVCAYTGGRIDTERDGVYVKR